LRTSSGPTIRVNHTVIDRLSQVADRDDQRSEATTGFHPSATFAVSRNRCLDRGHGSAPNAAEMAERYGAGTTVRDWQARLVCGACGGRRIDVVVAGTERRKSINYTAFG
jgi:hypothetical protein